MNKMVEFIDKNFDNMVEDLKKLIRIKSISGEKAQDAPFGLPVKEALNLMLDICEKNGLKTKNFDNYVGTASWGDNPKLAILSHLDVVPVTDNWGDAAFSPIIKDGKLFGRGAIDDKGPAICSVYALLSVIASGKMPDGGVRLIFGTDEEVGFRDLDYYNKLETMPKMVFTPDSDYPVINIEKGHIILTFERKINKKSNNEIMSIHGSDAVNVVPKTSKAIICGDHLSQIKELISNDETTCEFSVKEENGNLIVECEGKEAHVAFIQDGKNSLVGLITLLSKLNIDSEIKKSLNDLVELFPFHDIGGKTINIYSKDDESGELTLGLTKLDIIDDKIVCGLDIRFPVCSNKDFIMDVLREKLSSIGFTITKENIMDIHKVDPNSEFVKTLLSAYKDVTGFDAKCVSSGGGTYVHDIEGGVAFGCEFKGQDYNIHMDNEFIPLDELKLNTIIQAEAISRLATK